MNPTPSHQLQELLKEFDKHYLDLELGRRFDHKAIFRDVISKAFSLGLKAAEKEIEKWKDNSKPTETDLILENILKALSSLLQE